MKTPDTTCPRCGEADPGFADTDHPDQRVVCMMCGHVTTWSRWVACGHLRVVGPVTPDARRERRLYLSSMAAAVRGEGEAW